MGWGMAIGIGWPNASAGVSYVKKLIKTFKERVLSYSNSIFEAEPCLDATLTELNAIGLLKQASLVITPNAYNEGKLYDVVPNTTLGDMTVVRTTTATRVNSAGLIEVVPRNLLTYSNDFTNATWVNGGYGNLATVTPNNIISPDGLMNGSKIQFTAGATQGRLVQQTTVVNGSTNSVLVYVKKGNKSDINISCDLAVLGLSLTFNFDTLVLTNNGVSNSSATSVGNGWYLIKFSYVAPSVTSQIGFLTYNGEDGYIYAYGMQLEAGSTATEYFPTTTRLNIPRIDYTNGSCPSLLVEPQRTNLLTYSNDYSNTSWGKIGITAVLNSQLNPEGINSTYNISNTTLGDSYLEKQGLQTTAGNYTMSVFIKNIDNLTTSQLMAVHLVEGSITSQLTYTWATNTFTLAGTNAISGSSILYNNGWVRLTFTYIIGSSVSNHWARLYANQNLSITKSALVYGFQLEAGSYATSYIPTVATSVTRNADVISKTGISSLIGQTEGTIFWEGYLDGSVNTGQLVGVGKSGLDVIRIQKEGLLVLSVQVYNNGFAFIQTFPFVNGYNKIAFVYKSGNSFCYLNGTKMVFNTTSFTPTGILDEITINNLWQSNSDITLQNINSVQIYKTALSDTECINLTTL